ncbi:MAG: hypothetical protein ABII22_01705 [Candidatus Micrarchaeota archaeon]
MQTLEAMIAFLFLILIVSAIYVKPAETETALYRYALADDIWKTLEVRGDLRDFSFTYPFSAIPEARLMADLEEIGQQTNMCIGFVEEDIANCRDNQENAVFIEKTLIADGKPKKMTLFVSRKE